MKFRSMYLLLSAVTLTVTIIGCSSSDGGSSDNANCDELAGIHILPLAPVYIGAEITLNATPSDNVVYHWTGPLGWEAYNGGLPGINTSATVTGEAKIKHSGWYYLQASVEGCEDRIDSVYVDVKLNQGVPTCSLIDNKATFNTNVTLGNQTFYGSYYNANGVGGGYEVTANSSNGDMYLYFPSYWQTHPLADGIYYTTDDNSSNIDTVDRVYLWDVNGNISWHATAGYPVYVSHVAGKIRIAFCSIPFSGSFNGNPYTATINCQITQP
ncbi:hypothetical protein [Flavobacterium sp. XGLA_31]|uniref:hypothetical protein n=1 Tax=Flavobacterium sp. XGLA_31 TaxID=3447666 RepID=UPI003F3F106C